MRMVMSEVKKGPKDDQALQHEEAGVLRSSLFPGLNDDVENMILEYAGIESVVTLSLLSRAAYEYIRTRPTENNSLLPSMLQAHFKQKRGGRALPVVPASFSERPFQVIKGLLSQSEMRSSRSLEGHTCFVRAVSFSPDGRYFVSGSWDRT